MSGERIYFYDNTLRGGAQAAGIILTAADRLAIADALDKLGVDYLETSWPGAVDDSLMTRRTALGNARLAALCRLPRPDITIKNDARIAAMRDCGAKVISLTGLASARHVDLLLGCHRRRAIEAIAEAVSHVAGWAETVLFECEHFFDGYADDPAFSLECAATAYVHGARWVVLSDSNGGSLPDTVSSVTAEARKVIPSDHLGIRCLDDAGTAVAASDAAVGAGARLIAGSINGVGARCGYANLTTLIGNLALKRDYAIGSGALETLTAASHLVDVRLNGVPNPNAPYVGAAVFQHESSAIDIAARDNPGVFEHVPPARVGNRPRNAASGTLDRIGVRARLESFGIAPGADDAALDRVVRCMQEEAARGAVYDGADASLLLLVRRALGDLDEPFRVTSYRVIDERRQDARGVLTAVSEATVRVAIGGTEHLMVAEGEGPVHALDIALRKVLSPQFPLIDRLRLVDYKVRIVDSDSGTRALTRVMIDSADGGGSRWTTVGFARNVVDASYRALVDGMAYMLLVGAAAADPGERRSAGGRASAADGRA